MTVFYNTSYENFAFREYAVIETHKWKKEYVKLHITEFCDMKTLLLCDGIGDLDLFLNLTEPASFLLEWIFFKLMIL